MWKPLKKGCFIFLSVLEAGVYGRIKKARRRKRWGRQRTRNV
jgi:hypothetical protein